MMNLDALEKELNRACPEMETLKNEPMKLHTSFRVGGPAALMVFPETPGQAADLLRVCREREIVPFFMGNGSNLLVSDEGYDGLVISTARLDRLDRHGDRICAGAGVSLPKVAGFAAQEGLSGLEWAAGIPGSVGGAVYMNAGAYGGEIVQVLEWVNYCGEEGPGSFAVREGKLFRMVGDPDGEGEALTVRYQEEADSAFSYRHSYFCDHPCLVTLVDLCLTPGDPAVIRSRMTSFAAQRKAKQPLEYHSAGSTFKRPPPVAGEPVYAAALIDRCGLKGLTVGGAQVSRKHAGFIVNKGKASCADILKLIGEVRRRVYDETGVALELEVKTLGI